VAKLAGLPEFVIKGALEKQKCLLDPSYSQKKPTLEIVEDPPSPHPLCQDLVHLELNTLTPLEALNLLSVWKKKYQI
jgi:DNA mismatch repair ATPase MutS